MNVRHMVFAVIALTVFAIPAKAGTITTYSDSSSFAAAMGVPLTVEDFTDTFHFPITTGVLNSETNLVVAEGPPITPGLIQPGVTYSTPIGIGNFFNIDEGAGFVGGFLDNVTAAGSPGSALTTTFDSSVVGFGFNTSQFMGSQLNITINFTSGAAYVQSFAIGGGFPFFGFVSSATDIQSAIIYGNSGTVAFAIDNFTYQTIASVPEPSSLALSGIAAIAGLGVWVRKRRGSRA